MSRAADQHLSQDELEALLSEEVSGMGNSESEGVDGSAVRAHLSSCAGCKQLLERHVAAAQALGRLRTNTVSPPGPDCAGEDEWLRVAAGSLPPEQTEQKLRHAEQCGHCGPLLASAAEIFAADRTPEEEALIQALPSAQPGRQKMLASRLAASAARADRATKSRFAGWRSAPLFPRLAFSSAALLAVALAVWFAARPQPQREALRLLTEAYTQQRTIELRIPGAGYAPTNVVRGGETTRLSRPPSLLEAEALIAKHSRLQPDDAAWLHNQGLADLLDGNYDSAVTVLDRAHRSAPEDPLIALDLATAYVSRGDQSGAPADYGTAVELLSAILAKNPKDQLALFNRAIAQERMFAYHQARADWIAYLQLDSTSDWATEARTRLAALEEKIRRQSQSVGAPNVAKLLGVLRQL